MRYQGHCKQSRGPTPSAFPSSLFPSIIPAIQLTQIFVAIPFATNMRFGLVGNKNIWIIYCTSTVNAQHMQRPDVLVQTGLYLVISETCIYGLVLKKNDYTGKYFNHN